MSLRPKKKRRAPKRIRREVSRAFDTLIRHKKHVASVWLDPDSKDWPTAKSDMAYLVNKSIKRNE